MKKLLVADASEDFCVALRERLAGSYEIRLCREGNETLELLRSFRPELLVLDLELPGLDGISLIQWAAEEGIQPITLATVRGFFDYAADRLESLGVSYLMRKPCNLRAMEQRLADLAQSARSMGQPEPADARTWVTNVLLELGIPSQRRGFQCLIQAILEMMQDPAQQITKSLYPKVAAVCGGTGQQVERAMRAVIEAAWLVRDTAVWRRWLPAEICCSTGRPTNAAFICSIANRLNLRDENGTRNAG